MSTFRILTYFKLVGVTFACRALKDKARVQTDERIVEAYLVRYAPISRDRADSTIQQQASYLGVFLYFAAGILADPDGPYMPTKSHCSTWLIALFYELSLLVMISRYSLEQTVFVHLSIMGIALGGLRSLVLCTMLAIFISTQYHVYQEEETDCWERESLRANGQVTYGEYGTMNKNGGMGIKSYPKDLQPSGWLDYIAGFRILFPYIWSMAFFFCCLPC